MTNLKFAIRRAMQIIGVLLASTFLISLLLKLMPFDLADVVAPFASQEEKDKISQQLGLDRNPFISF
jgi:ABC-type dipeptide/oligopeptide/nickel transport system permease component